MGISATNLSKKIAKKLATTEHKASKLVEEKLVELDQLHNWQNINDTVAAEIYNTVKLTKPIPDLHEIATTVHNLETQLKEAKTQRDQLIQHLAKKEPINRIAESVGLTRAQVYTIVKKAQ